jgi:hypothetical protein
MDDESGLCADEAARSFYDGAVWFVADVFSGGDMGCVSSLQAAADAGNSGELLATF